MLQKTLICQEPNTAVRAAEEAGVWLKKKKRNKIQTKTTLCLHVQGWQSSQIHSLK